MNPIRCVTDAAALVWPIRGGYKIFLPYATDRTWPLMRAVAWLHRRTALRRTRVIAVIGSVGKTTTKRMIDAALGDGAARHGLGNYGVSLAQNVLMTRPRHAFSVFETAIAGRGRMAGYGKLLAPHVAVVTAVKSDHRRSLPTLEDTRDEKAHMVRALKRDGVAILNGDDPNVRWMATQTAARVIAFGTGEDNAVRATDIRLEWPEGMTFTLHCEGQTHSVRLKLFGRHMIYPALAAVAVGRNEGVPLDQIIERIQAVLPTPRRLEPIRLANGAILISDDFKGSVESTLAALDAFAEVKARRRILVLGDISEVEGSLHAFYRDLGRRVVQVAERVVLVGSQASVRTLIAEAVRCGLPRTAITHTGSDIHEAIAIIKAELAPGDAVLVKGSSAQRIERISLALQDIPVACAVKWCGVRALPCRLCPMLNQPRAAFSNVYVRMLTRLPGEGDGNPLRSRKPGSDPAISSAA